MSAEIFRHYKGTDFSAKATSHVWLLMNTGDLYGSLNRLSKAIGAHEDAWHGWRYRDADGTAHPIRELRDESKITKRRRPRTEIGIDPRPLLRQLIAPHSSEF